MDHVGAFSLGTCAHFINFYRESGSETITFPAASFVVVTPFSWFSSKESHQFPLKRNVFSSFLSKLSLSPKDVHTLWKLTRYCTAMVTAEISFSARDSLQKATTGDKRTSHWSAYDCFWHKRNYFPRAHFKALSVHLRNNRFHAESRNRTQIHAVRSQ